MWFRRDLRVNNNPALSAALKASNKERPVLCVFIFDTQILNDLPVNDARVSFIMSQLEKIHHFLKTKGSALRVEHGNPLGIWPHLIAELQPASVFFNRDYEPYARRRDDAIAKIADSASVQLSTFRDHVIFEPGEILKSDGKPYTVYTPYKNRWLSQIKAYSDRLEVTGVSEGEYYSCEHSLPTLADLGFKESLQKVRPANYDVITEYDLHRDYPAKDAVGYFGPHLRFGTIDIRSLTSRALHENEIFLSELIWREFFIHILYNFPHVVEENFKPKYNLLQWRNNEKEFEKWCRGETGYAMVDAGMRQLNVTGYMHNRLRMITAGFLTKHLLIDWRWGESYFAEKLLDYELASNNGNWQWAAGTGCDAAPYFRIFNPETQLKKFDQKGEYVKRWLAEFSTLLSRPKIVEHAHARERALAAYKKAIADYGLG